MIAYPNKNSMCSHPSADLSSNVFLKENVSNIHPHLNKYDVNKAFYEYSISEGSTARASDSTHMMHMLWCALSI